MTRGKRAPTIKDIALRLDLGVTTVSDILLRGKTNYRAATAARVRAAAAELGYRPNALAQSIRRGRTQTIGLVLTRNLLNPFYAGLVDRLEARFATAGQMVLLTISDRDADHDRQAIAYLESRRVDGLVIGPVYRRTPATEAYAPYRSNIPAVMFLAEDDAPADTVGLSGGHRALGLAAARHFLSRGHTRIGYLGCAAAPRPDGGGPQDGFYEALVDAGHYDETLFWLESDPRPHRAHARMREILAGTPRPALPTAIYCHNDDCAIGALAAVREAGLRCPDDISLIGTDNIAAAPFTDPPLTTFDLAPAALADAVFDLLVQRLAKPRLAFRHLHVEPVFVERGSVRSR